MAKDNDFSVKVRELLVGRRRFSKRLLLSLLPALAVSFTLFFFGPLDLTYVSRNYISYSPFNILPYTAMVMGIIFVILLLAASVPGGKVHAFLVSVYTGLAAAMYIQGAFLNPDFGTMDGHSVNWPSFSTIMMVNAAVWFVILLIPHLVHFFNKRVWRGFVTVVSAALILMQAVSLGVKLTEQHNSDQEKAGSYYLSMNNILKVGRKNNIVVFLLDTVSNSDVDGMLQKYPDALNLLHDFARYDNANSHYMYTVPSIASILTGQEWDCENELIPDFLNSAWKSPEASAFYQTLSDKGYERNFFALLPELAQNPAVLKETVSNLMPSNKDFTLDRAAFIKLIKLSFYRYFPVMMKPFFVIYTSDISHVLIQQNAMKNEWAFPNAMNSTSTSLSEGDYQNAFFFYYLQGTHMPYQMDERGRPIHNDLPGSYVFYTDKETQLAGHFYLISDYIRQLKAMGLYDQTGFIIMADHGDNENKKADHQPIYFIRMPGEYRDTIEVRSAQITVQDSFMADVMSMVGEKNELFGVPSAEIPEGPAERWCRTYGKDNDYPGLSGKRFNVMREYRYEGDGDRLIEKWVTGAFDTYPMVDCYY